jgi:hypothetical protein
MLANMNLVWRLLRLYAMLIKQKINWVETHRVMITVSIHKFFQLSASVDRKENFISILQHQETTY